MAHRIIVLSGPVASGKTTLGDTLVERYGFRRVKTRELIRSFLGTELERDALQLGGEALDRRTGGRWVADALGREVVKLDGDQTVLVDSVRIEPQVKAIRQAFGSAVTHVHLTSPLIELARRYRRRPKRLKELATYDEVRANPTERKVDALRAIADIVVDTHRSTADQVVVRVAARLGLYGRTYDRLVDVLVGGRYGSEGKGRSQLIWHRSMKF